MLDIMALNEKLLPFPKISSITLNSTSGNAFRAILSINIHEDAEEDWFNDPEVVANIRFEIVQDALIFLKRHGIVKEVRLDRIFLYNLNKDDR